MILFIDDELFSLETNRRKLISKGLNVVGATSLDEALYLIESNPFIQAIVVNMHITNETGLGLIYWLRENRPVIKRIILTSHFNKNEIEKGLSDDEDTKVLEQSIDLETQLFPYIVDLLKEEETWHTQNTSIKNLKN